MKATSASLLTVIGDDRPGIIAKVTGVLYRTGCNLEDIAMTILENELAMIMIVSGRETQRKQAETGLRTLGKAAPLTFFWKEMGRQAPYRKPSADTVRYLITAIGKDRTGIVHKISQILATAGLNITDLNSKILGTRGKALYALALEVDVPKRFEIKKLDKAFSPVRRTLELDIAIKPVESIEF